MNKHNRDEKSKPTVRTIQEIIDSATPVILTQKEFDQFLRVSRKPFQELTYLEKCKYNQNIDYLIMDKNITRDDLLDINTVADKIIADKSTDNSRLAEAYLKKAQTFQQLGYIYFHQSKVAAEKALELAPDMIEAKLRLAYASFAWLATRKPSMRVVNYHEWFEKEINNISKIIEECPDYAVAWWCRGNIKYFQFKWTRQPVVGLLESAVEDFSQAIQINPDWNICQARGTVNIVLKNYNEAIDDFTQAIKYEKKNAYLYQQRGEAFEAIQEFYKAYVDYQESLRLEPDNIGLLDKIYAILMERGEYSKAKEYLNKKQYLEQKKINESIISYCYTQDGLEYIKKELKDILTQEEITNIPAYDKERNILYEYENLKRYTAYNECVKTENYVDLREEILGHHGTYKTWFTQDGETLLFLFWFYENHTEQGFAYTKENGFQKFEIKNDAVAFVDFEKHQIRKVGLKAVEFYLALKYIEYRKLEKKNHADEE